MSLRFSSHLLSLDHVWFDFVYVDSETARTVFQARRRLPVFGDLELPVVSPEHLVIMEFFAARAMTRIRNSRSSARFSCGRGWISIPCSPISSGPAWRKPSRRSGVKSPRMAEPSFPWDPAGAARDRQAIRSGTPGVRSSRFVEYPELLEALPLPLMELQKVKAFPAPFPRKDPRDV